MGTKANSKAMSEDKKGTVTVEFIENIRSLDDAYKIGQIAELSTEIAEEYIKKSFAILK